MARFMTREVEGIFQKLRKEVKGTDISVCSTIERWHMSHAPDEPFIDLKFTIQSNIKACELFDLKDYSSLEVMVGEALAKIREWKGAENESESEAQIIRISPPDALKEDERIERAIELGFEYGSIDGGHHKMWVIDQMIRILTDCPTITLKAVDVNQTEYEYQSLGESDKYRELMATFRDGEDGPETYSWDEGIAP